MVISYIKKTSKLENAPQIFFLFILYAAFCALGYWKKDLIGLFAVMIGMPFMFLFALKPETYLVLFISLFSLIPAKYHGATYDMFPIYYNKFFALPFAFVFITILYVSLSVNNERNLLRKRPFDFTGLILAVYIVLSIFAAIRGLAFDHNKSLIASQIIPVCLFFCYYSLRTYFRWKQNYFNWIWFLFFLGIAVALFYAYMTAHNFTDLFSFVLLRAVTHHGQLMIATVPIAASLFLITKNKWIKTLLVIGALLFLIQIFLSQQRILWVVVVFQVAVFSTLFVFKSGFNLKNLAVWIGLLLGGLLLLAGIVLIATWYFQTDLSFLLKRWEDVQGMKDGSFMMRIYDSKHAIALTKNDWFWGLGMGALLRSIPTGQLQTLFDQSYMYPYFYGGLFVTLSLVLFYLSGIYKSFVIYLKVKDEKVRMIALAIVTTLAGQMGSGMTDVTMSHFPHLFIWVFLIAMTTVMYENYILEPHKLKSSNVPTEV